MAKDERHQTEVASRRRIEAMEMEIMKSDCYVRSNVTSRAQELSRPKFQSSKIMSVA